MSITAEQLDAAVQHSLGHGAMAHDDPMTTMVTELALHQDWPPADQAAYRSVAGQMSAPAAATDAAADAADMWFIERAHPLRWAAYYLLAIGGVAAFSAWLDAIGWSVW